jgi:hypothetical protein
MAIKLMAVNCAVTLSLLTLFYVRSQAQSIEEKYRLIDTLGIVISAHEFDSLVDSLSSKFKSDTSAKGIKDYLLLIRVGNTIAFDHLYESSTKCNELFTLFASKYMDTIVKLTDATISIGLSYYSKKYDLQIGGVKTKNNWYRIIH